MIVSLIVAVDENDGIGFEGHLPWRLPDEQQYFKALTMGHHLISGRKTYESIGRSLPGRTTIVLSRDPAFQSSSTVLLARSLEAALELAAKRGEDEVFVMGGGDVFQQALPHADRIYLTRVHAQFPADTTFPDFDPKNWREERLSHHPPDERHPYAYTTFLYERTSRL